MTVCAELDRRQWITLGLERVEELLTALDHPQRKLRIVQVVGTNGKGTTAATLAGALEAEGHSAGAYLSPHLNSYTERLKLGGRYVTEEEFAAGMGHAIRIADEREIPASQFELLTVGAIHMFAEEGVEWAVLEAGLGARYDATTAAESEAVVLTNAGLDHTEYLGETVEEVAVEKLAGLRPGSKLILGTGDRRVLKKARERCEEIGAALVLAGDADLTREEAPHLAPYARRNVALGLRAGEALLGGEFSRRVGSDAVTGTGLPGRFDRVEYRGVTVVVDGGHNPAGLAAALDGVRSVYPERPLEVVFGALRDKDIPSMLFALRSRADTLTLTRPRNERAAEPEWIQREFKPLDSSGREAVLVDDVCEALDLAAEDAKEIGGVLLVTGSLYTAAEALAYLRGGETP